MLNDLCYIYTPVSAKEMQCCPNRPRHSCHLYQNRSVNKKVIERADGAVVVVVVDDVVVVVIDDDADDDADDDDDDDDDDSHEQDGGIVLIMIIMVDVMTTEVAPCLLIRKLSSNCSGLVIKVMHSSSEVIGRNPSSSQ